MLLVYPVAGTDLTTPSYRQDEHAVPLSKSAIEWFVKNTIQSPADPQDTRLNVYGRANLAGLPPATIINAEIDPLASDGKLLAEKMRAARVRVTYIMSSVGVSRTSSSAWMQLSGRLPKRRTLPRGS